MTILLNELSQQPLALRNLLHGLNTSQDDIFTRLGSAQSSPLITGMGASYHAAWIGALHMVSLGIPAMAIEAIDLVGYGQQLLRHYPSLIYISQSGESGEVAETLKVLPREMHLVALTNHPDSRLGRSAQTVVPLLAGDEALIASKTYLNSLAWLWLAAHRWTGSWDGTECDSIARIADGVEGLLDQRSALVSRLMEAFTPDSGILLVGHGPAAATARQAAMMLSEWAKVPARSAGIAAFRHGFIEATQPGSGIVVFASPGKMQASAIALARELDGYGARVLVIHNGRVDQWDKLEKTAGQDDEFLSPLLDIIPIQLYADALVEASRMEPGFRYIRKVVQSL